MYTVRYETTLETTLAEIETYVQIPTIVFIFRSGRRRRWGRGCRTQHQIRGSGNQIQGPAAAQQELRGGEGGREQCCGSGMFIPDPAFYPSRSSDLGYRIPDPKTAMKISGKNIFWSQKFHEIEVFYF
jgi:hypothetical protein